MALRPFTIVFSHYTGLVFAWSGMPDDNERYLGNRAIVGYIEALNDADALARWFDS